MSPLQAKTAVDRIRFEASFWRHGRVWSAIRVGSPAGVMCGVLEYAVNGSVAEALLAAVALAAMFGSAVAWGTWRRWPGARDLDPGDRVAVARVIERGQAVEDHRLALAVIDYAGRFCSAVDRDHPKRRTHWIVVTGLTLVLALTATVRGSTPSAIVWWVLFASWLLGPAWTPRRRARRVDNARRAERAARQMLQSRPGD
jgi:hypothetical protein